MGKKTFIYLYIVLYRDTCTYEKNTQEMSLWAGVGGGVIIPSHCRIAVVSCVTVVMVVMVIVLRLSWSLCRGHRGCHVASRLSWSSRHGYHVMTVVVIAVIAVVMLRVPHILPASPCAQAVHAR